MSLNTADLDWDEQGSPFSRQFQDIYFSRNGGLEETRYLYLGQNHLPERWLGHFEHHQHFSIAETGFGTGLNFLATLHEWFKHTGSGQLHYFSVEKFPLSQADLQRALSQWPELQQEAELLLRHYPSPVPGLHNLWLTDNCCLHLYFGDASDGLAHLQAGQGIDAWYLDGFAPAKNADIWQPEIMQQVGRHSRAGASFATFTVAGFVRRGLIAAGFKAEKVPGFDTKKHMLRGDYLGPISLPQGWLHWPTSESHQIAIIGGGLAGTALAQALSRRGRQCLLLEQDSDLAQQASGNPIGGFHPALESQWSIASRYHLQACLHLLHELTHWSPIFWAPGVFRAAQSETEQQLLAHLAANLNLPSELFCWDAARQGIWLPGGSLSPIELCQQRWHNACRYQPQNQLIRHCQVESIQPTAQGWLLQSQQQSYQCQHLILANAAAASQLLPELNSYLQSLRGQISYLPADITDEPLYCGNKYLTAAMNDIRVLGATFSRDSTNEQRLLEHQQNLAGLAQERADLQPRLQQLGQQPLSGRVGFRCVSPDHLPLVGPWPERAFWQREYADLQRGKPEQRYPAAEYLAKLSLCVGLGARGINQSGLAAEFLAASLTGEPLPLARDIALALHPARFWLKQLKRGQPL